MAACDICAWECVIPEGCGGRCGQYAVKDGEIVERFPDRYLVACPISIETMPILHAYPGQTFLQISTLGCNLSCEGCISTMIVREMEQGNRLLQHIPPDRVADMAVEKKCRGIVFLMNDPLASYLTFIGVARAAKSLGLAVGCSTNGLFTKESLKRIMPYLDFINLGMKGLFDASYRACGATGAKPVLENMKLLHENGVHIEVSTMLRTDNQEELRALARYVASLSIKIPFQVMRFIPFGNADISLEPTIDEAETFCRELNKTLDFVYLFNSPGPGYLDTCCPVCKKRVYRRDFYGPMGAKLLPSERPYQKTGRCPDCGEDLSVRGTLFEARFTERGFEGGYPFTRALEIIEAMVIPLGVSRPGEMTRTFEFFLREKGLQAFHHEIQDPIAFIAMIRLLGRINGIAERAETLAGYLERKLAMIDERLEGILFRPRVYYAMGTPLFALNSGRMENRLVERAGGYSVNTELPGEGRPGRSIEVGQLNRLNPEVIFISSFISDPVHAFYWKCLKLGVEAGAVKNHQIYTHPSPGWDFGSPRWILGLIYLAVTLHPERFDLDVTEEARKFYRIFYNMEYDPSTINRSFSKPSRLWRWDGETAMTA